MIMRYDDVKSFRYRGSQEAVESGPAERARRGKREDRGRGWQKVREEEGWSHSHTTGIMPASQVDEGGQQSLPCVLTTEYVVIITE
jgi:hypothetical protein